MSHNTITLNKTRQDLSKYNEIWLFAYASLIYKVDFPYISKATCHIKGWQRRFWQGNNDHRGTPEAPARVVTLIANPISECFGIGYQVTQDVFEHLDQREQNGYLRDEVDIHFSHGEVKAGLVYIAPPDNAAYLGPAPITQIAQQIQQCRGSSGHNRDYALALAAALHQLNIDDDHVFAVEKALKT